MEKALPAIPEKRYFTIGEVSDLCGVKPYVLRYWEQEFTQLKPMKRRGNRRYYQHHEVVLVRRIRDLLYEQGFTIHGARHQLDDGPQPPEEAASFDVDELEEPSNASPDTPPAKKTKKRAVLAENQLADDQMPAVPTAQLPVLKMAQIREELVSIRGLLVV
jgi:DNA-binding transcriptional MerR regulator